MKTEMYDSKAKRKTTMISNWCMLISLFLVHRVYSKLSMLAHVGFSFKCNGHTNKSCSLLQFESRWRTVITWVKNALKLSRALLTFFLITVMDLSLLFDYSFANIQKKSVICLYACKIGIPFNSNWTIFQSRISWDEYQYHGTLFK